MTGPPWGTSFTARMPVAVRCHHSGDPAEVEVSVDAAEVLLAAPTGTIRLTVPQALRLLHVVDEATQHAAQHS